MGYDITLFNLYGEEEILLEPERKFVIEQVYPPFNDIIHVRCNMIKSNMVLNFDNDNISEFILKQIMAIIKRDYSSIQELIEYKIDGTLTFLEAQRAMVIYSINLGLNIKRDVKNWDDFIIFSKNYSKLFVQEGLKKYQIEERYEKNNKKTFLIFRTNNRIIF